MAFIINWYKQLSFFRKQLLVATVVTCITLLMASLMLYGKYVSDYKANLLEQVTGKAQLIAVTSRSALLFDDTQTAIDILNSLETFANIQFGVLLDAEQQVFAQFRHSGFTEQHQASLPELTKLSPGNAFMEGFLYVYQPVVMDGENIGYVLIVSDTNVMAEEKYSYLMILLGVFVISLSASFFMHWQLQGFIAAPMNKLVELVGYVARNRRYNKRIGIKGKDELGSLISGVNSMLDTIEEHEKQLYAHSERLESLVALRTEQLFNRANYDALTQLPNRHLLVDRLNHGIDNASRESSQMALMFLDLDRFKFINDNLGHSVGDELLVKVAHKLTSVVRKADSVCRWGGDEFIILLEHLHNKEDIVPLAEQIIYTLNEPIELSGNQLHVSTSIGIARFPDDGKDSSTLLKHADVAMYKAKEQGLSQYCFFEQDMIDGSMERLTLEHKLREALENKSFHLVYQPQICTETNAVSGIEALIRWQDDELGLLNPVQFLPVAEDVGLMHSLSLWVLEEACGQNAHWQEQGGDKTRVAVNLPASFIMHPNAVGQIVDILETTGLQPKYLEIEITENTFITNTEHAIKVLEQLRKMDINIAVDDFGTGYSSMSYLRDLPVGTLKIDGSFVRQMGSDTVNDGIIQSIITLGKSLGLSLIAECVENQDQAAQLKKMGCDMIQGYYFSKPLSADDIEDFLLERRKST
jgi:diguanylate cyclase (GGDEF)-like protein